MENKNKKTFNPIMAFSDVRILSRQNQSNKNLEWNEVHHSLTPLIENLAPKLKNQNSIIDQLDFDKIIPPGSFYDNMTDPLTQ